MIKKYDTSSLHRPSNGEVRRAGEVLKKWKEDNTKRKLSTLIWWPAQEFEIAQAWRSLHMYPLNTFQAMLRQKLKSLSVEPLVAQRLKRMPTIINKLSRMQGTLETMQDIGGIRVILPDIPTLRMFETKLEHARFQHKLVRKRDYIYHPKSDGYRGVHLIYKCFSNKAPKEVQGLTIELQLRTELQHYWATAVEAVDMFYGESLKIGKGAEIWREFFVAASAAFAVIEGVAIPADFEGITTKGIKKNLLEKEKKVKAISAFEAMQNIAKGFRLSHEDKQYHLLCFYREAKGGAQFEHIAFTHKEEAEKVYDVMESRFRDTSDDVVLVSTRMEDLETLYSNYFLNVDGFLKALKQVMGV